jgi:hypothetical protein
LHANRVHASIVYVFFLLTCSCGVLDFPFCSDKKEFKINKIGIKTFVFDEWNI